MVRGLSIVKVPPPLSGTGNSRSFRACFALARTVMAPAILLFIPFVRPCRARTVPVGAVLRRMGGVGVLFL